MKKTEDITKLLSEVSKANKEKHQVLTTGIKSLDYILGGGIELGSKMQLIAESSTGKSTIALNICRNMCRQGINVLYVDTENSITEELLKSTKCINYCNNDNANVGQFVLLKESDFDTVSDYLDRFIANGSFKLIVIDSLACMVNNCYVNIESKRDIKPITNNNTNYESRPLNLFINKYSCLSNKYNIALLYINQYRNKIHPTQGTIIKEYGNKIVRYNSDVILKIKSEKDTIYQDENNIYLTNIKMPQTHAKLSITVDKSNKVLSGTSVETYIKYGYGIDEDIDKIFDMIRNNEIIQNGKYYNLVNENNKIDGFINLVNYIVSKEKEHSEHNIEESSSNITDYDYAFGSRIVDFIHDPDL